MQITINEDSTFLISNELGDISVGAELGLYHEDTRFLSRYELLLDGQPPLVLSARATDYCSAMHYLTNPVLPEVPRGQLSIIRRRSISRGLLEGIEIINHSERAAEFTLDLGLDADFAHIFEVKSTLETHHDPVRRKGIFAQERGMDGCRLRLRNERGVLVREVAISVSQPPEVMGELCHYSLRLAPRERWQLHVEVTIASMQAATEPAESEAPRVAGAAPVPVLEPVHGVGIVGEAPAFHCGARQLEQAYEQSVQDYAALRLASERGGEGEFVIAAGIPWFMTLFGRDSLIAAYQALPLFPAAAKGVLRALARLQGTRVDVPRGEEPGKILHESRAGAQSGALRILSLFPYYGTVDATPLFLVLLAAVYRVTKDRAFVRQLYEPAMRALAWMDQYGDRDGDGYIEYLREGDAGLVNQGWKDSSDAVRYHDGTLAHGAIALCEVQGYAYAARIGMAEICAVLGERKLAARLREQAAELRRRFNTDFWLRERSYFAMALDGAKRQVDAITSNPGHLLWAGIVEPELAPFVAARLLSPEMFSGWGIRTMATTEGGYNPISYHCGSVWPHDTSLIVAGLARYGFVREAARVADGLLSALRFYPDHRLPELFAGYGNSEAPFPVEYPTANRPQAWASGSTFLLVSTMAGFDASQSDLRGSAFLPSQLESLRLDGIWAGRSHASIELAQTVRGGVSRSFRRMYGRSRRWSWLPWLVGERGA